MGCDNASFKAMGKPFIEYELQDYVEEFESVYNTSIGVSVEFAEINDGNVIGRCYYGKDYRVVIDIEFFENNKHNYYAIHQLIFHELGHCHFGLAHNNNKENTKPVSIMNSYAFGYDPYYELNLDYYMDSLIDNRAVYLNQENQVIGCGVEHETI